MIYKPDFALLGDSIIYLTTSSKPASNVKSLPERFGIKFISGAGGLGGGICRRVFSSCFRRASLAAACITEIFISKFII